MDHDRTIRSPARTTAIRGAVAGAWLRLRSESFAGEWPNGVHWQSGEVRDIPADYPRTGEPPAGLVPMGPREDAAGEG